MKYQDKGPKTSARKGGSHPHGKAGVENGLASAHGIEGQTRELNKTKNNRPVRSKKPIGGGFSIDC